MLHSTTTAAQIIETARGNTDISFEVTDAEMLLWLNALEQLLYSDVIRFQRRVTAENPAKDALIRYDSFVYAEDESQMEARDVLSVAADGIELDRVSAGWGQMWLAGQRPVWYPDTDGIRLSLDKSPELLEIAYTVRPKLFTEDAMDTDTIHIAPEFLPMVIANLRGNLYHVANENALAAQWFGDYNTQLETFKAWCADHLRHYGV